MNKKGELGEQITIVLFIFLIIIIGSGITLGVFMFVGGEIDFRQADADMLNYDIRKCIVENNLKEDVELEGFYEVCSLNSDVIKQHHKIKICVDSEDCIAEENPLISTKGDFQVCEARKEQEQFPKCSINSVIKQGKNYVVVTLSKQRIKRLVA